MTVICRNVKRIDPNKYARAALINFLLIIFDEF